MIKAYLLDDEHSAHVVLRTLIKRHFPEIKIVGGAQDAKTAIKEIALFQPDLLFLDIEMPNISGMEMIKQVDKEKCSVIFVTAYDNFAVDAFTERARGYILKPVDREKFTKTVSDVIRKIRLEKTAHNASNKQKSNDFVSVPHAGEYEMLNPKKIIYLQADGSYTKIFTQEEDFHISKNLKTTIEEFGSESVVRVSRSHAVNPNFIKSYSKRKGGTLQLQNGVQISISSSYKKSVFELLDDNKAIQ